MKEENLARAAAQLLSEQLRTARPERTLRRDADVIERLAQEIGRRPKRRWRRLSAELGLLAAAVLFLVVGSIWQGRSVPGIASVPALVRDGGQAAAAGLTAGQHLLVRTADAPVEVRGISLMNS
jgi:hypothetical protein